MARPKGYKHTAESLAKMSAIKKGRKPTDETRRRIAASLIGHKTSDEARVKMSEGVRRNKMRAAKIAATMKGRRPHGSGGDPTPAEARLLSYLPTNWTLHYLVRGMKSPGCVVDIAEPERRIAVFLDGANHDKPVQQVRDQRKSEFLMAPGWDVLRIKNFAVFENIILQSKICELLAKIKEAA